MYNKLYTKFKNELEDRRLDLYLITIGTIVFLLYCLFIAIIWWFDKSRTLPIASCIIFIFTYIFNCYIIIFYTLKRDLKFKDFFNIKKVFSVLMSSQSTDIDIMLKILKELNINTETDLQKAIIYFQNVLFQKSKKGVSVTNVLSITVSVLGLFFSGISYTKTEDLLFILFTLSSILIYIASICIAAKLIYKIIFYSLSKNALYERIVRTLSEIDTSNMLNRSTAQFGFRSHLI